MSTTKWSELKKQADDATRPIPDDWYEIVVTKAELKEASTGSPMIVTTFKVDSGPHAGRSLFTNFVFTAENPNALMFFFRNMEAFGFNEDFFTQLEAQGVGVEAGLHVIAEQIVGRKVRAEVGSRTWQGQPRNEIKQYAFLGGPLGSGPVVPVVTLGVPGPGAAAGGSMPPVPSVGALPPTPSSPAVAATPSASPATPPPVPPAF